MKARTTLAQCVGNWRGTNKLQDPHHGIEEQSPSAATLVAESDRSVRFDYTWSYRGKPQKGSLLIRIDGDQVKADWTDTWHMSDTSMSCVGEKRQDESISLMGTYPAPPGPDWGWRIDLIPDSNQLRLLMWNIWPAEQGGKEELAVEAVYTRAA